MLRDLRAALLVSDGVMTDNKSEHQARALKGADGLCAAIPKQCNGCVTMVFFER